MTIKNKLSQMLVMSGIAINAFAATESVELSGKLVDQYNASVSGVEVEIKSLDLKTTTSLSVIKDEAIHFVALQ